MREWLLVRGNGGRGNRWPGKPTDVKTAAAAGTPASRLTGYAFVLSWTAVSVSGGQSSPNMVHSLWPDGSGKKTLEMRSVIRVVGLSTWMGSPGSFSVYLGHLGNGIEWNSVVGTSVFPEWHGNRSGLVRVSEKMRIMRSWSDTGRTSSPDFSHLSTQRSTYLRGLWKDVFTQHPGDTRARGWGSWSRQGWGEVEACWAWSINSPEPRNGKESVGLKRDNA